MQRQRPASVPTAEPFVLVETGAHGLRITAANQAALAAGIQTGFALADARAAVPGLHVHPAEPARDTEALMTLASWLGRYGPARNMDGPDGIWIDITGVPHLFGGETRLCADLSGRLRRLGLTPRIGLAGSQGVAHALARFGVMREAHGTAAIAPEGTDKIALAGLPIGALRLAPDIVRLLVRLGLKRIGQLYGLPRASLAARFRDVGKNGRRQLAEREAAIVLWRLDQALGLLAEPRRPLQPPPEASSRLAFAEPLVTSATIETALDHLIAELTGHLAAQGLGARRFALALYRVDGSIARLAIGTRMHGREPGHIRRLLGESLNKIEAGFGIDLAMLEATELAPLHDEQARLDRIDGDLPGSDAGTAGISHLVDRLSNRLGASRVLTFAVQASHIPERAAAWTPVIDEAPATMRGCSSPRPAVWPSPGPPPSRVTCVPELSLPAPPVATPPRPPFLLTPPEPISVIAEIPQGAPQRFVWRRVPHRIVKSEGPERLAPEWWRHIGRTPGERELSRTRDYYRLEDTTGARYWVFRDGLYERPEDGFPVVTDAMPRWFLHGFFA